MLWIDKRRIFCFNQTYNLRMKELENQKRARDLNWELRYGQKVLL